MTPSSLEGPPGGGGGAVFVLLDDHPDHGLLQQASPHVGEVHLQLGGDEGEANLKGWVPLEDGASEYHPAKEAGPTAAAEEVALPEKNKSLTLLLEIEDVSKDMDLCQRQVYLYCSS